MAFDAMPQDTDSPGWRRLLTLIDEAAADGREVFQPFTEMSFDERLKVVTLPPTIAKLTEVRRLVLYNTRLVRLPPEIGAMTNLEEFWPYQSHRLRWFPYEVTRCLRLRDSSVSTRVLYGNFRNGSSFPHLSPVTTIDRPDRLDPAVRGVDAVRTCSVCDGPVNRELHQVWISLRVATDVLPLLVNACSATCVASLPQPAPGYLSTPHTGCPRLEPPGSFW
ncbi:hypothetical protein Q0Z83_039790 [Actinoplanes sichuanensis]|uniref:Leucine-rich repeat domain-containing protein n=1 Tax=Actinoplanes sichuanensis TaxID=512349 RepID=A0ABW4A3E8_9ACTN|nr:leucine-rich repeat domain-containing protein [Actinoplanes sichuanensis]BEL05788.1 hypothetical protein Q0Z83_039790 [Actinoplanes sichuanensis]